jgi:glycosyltransferase involved in cell wall biosynthesis
VLQTGSAHMESQAELLKGEMAKFGGGESVAHPGKIRRAVREYEEADVIVVPSPFVYKTFVERGVSEDKLAMVPWAALPIVSSFHDGNHREGGTARILFVGGCSLRKGIPYLFDAARSLGNEVAVRLVGRADPKLFASWGGLPSNVEAVGVKRGEALRTEFRYADIFVLPSIEDGSALVTIEAMLARLPVVVSDQAGAALVTEGESGFIVPAGDSQALAERILVLARDPGLRQRIGFEAHAAATARTPEVYGDELTRLVYQPLVNGTLDNRAAPLEP